MIDSIIGAIFSYMQIKTERETIYNKYTSAKLIASIDDANVEVNFTRTREPFFLG